MPRFKMSIKCPGCLRTGMIVVECDTANTPNGMCVDCAHCHYVYIRGGKKFIAQGELIPGKPKEMDESRR